MGILRRLLAQPRHRRGLLVDAVIWLLVARAGLLLRPVACLARVLGRRAVGAQGRYSAADAAWAVEAVGARIGMGCLPRALALHAMLSRGGLDSKVVLGVGTSASGTFAAHAWIACEGADLMRSGEVARYEAFPPLPS